MKRKTVTILIAALLAAPALAVESQNDPNAEHRPGAPAEIRAPSHERDAASPSISVSPSDVQTQPASDAESVRSGSDGDDTYKTSPADTERGFLSRAGDGQLSTDNLIGLEVVDAHRESIGRIDALMLESDGRVAGAVLSIGGVLGVGGKRVGVPWDRLEVYGEQDFAVLQMTRSEIERAPEFEPHRKSWIERQLEG